jgi:hypothetical protein
MPILPLQTVAGQLSPSSLLSHLARRIATWPPLLPAFMAVIA